MENDFVNAFSEKWVDMDYLASLNISTHLVNLIPLNEVGTISKYSWKANTVWSYK